MPPESGWTKGKTVIAWINGAPSLTQLKIHKLTTLPVQRELLVILVAYHWSHAAVLRAAENHGRRVGTKPVYDIISRTRLFDNPTLGSVGSKILNRVYGALGCDEQEDSTPPIPARRYLGIIKSTRLFLIDDQNNAVNLIRYVSDSAAAVERVPLPVDLNEACRKFREGRIRYEYYAAREDGLLEIPVDEREKYMLPERDVSKTVKTMANILFEVNP
ncbi:unnamed protein product [Heligmosomoides polygyrus]|uniref:Recombinase domain-containing protein n=1 Tax=Heligmosomoides polygyrus TaxID=6339 RepID=A0A183GIJ1_HELPZ|nr:unnamed protein product [Heligmosomoides polygyrus]